MATAKKKKKKKKKKTPDATALAQRKHKQGIRKLFAHLGFERIKTDGQEFTFKGRTGELDDVFVWENIMVVAEYTVSQDPTPHVAKKNILYGLIRAHSEEWVTFVRSTFPQAPEKMQPKAAYLDSEYQVRICYFSSQVISEEIEKNLTNIKFLNGTTLRYFDSLAKSIHRSARYEFFKYLGIQFHDIGQNIKSSSTISRTFAGYVLPSTFSSFPPNFKVVSFYADPDTLLTMSYVLRRDSWRDDEGMYQRVLQRTA